MQQCPRFAAGLQAGRQASRITGRQLNWRAAICVYSVLADFGLQSTCQDCVDLHLEMDIWTCQLPRIRQKMAGPWRS